SVMRCFFTSRSSRAPASCARIGIPVNAKQQTTAVHINFFTSMVFPWLVRRYAAGLWLLLGARMKSNCYSCMATRLQFRQFGVELAAVMHDASSLQMDAAVN